MLICRIKVELAKVKPALRWLPVPRSNDAVFFAQFVTVPLLPVIQILPSVACRQSISRAVCREENE